MPTNFTAKTYPSLTAVLHQMVLRAPSGLDVRTIGELAGYKSYQTLMSELSRQPGHKLGADMLLALMDAARSDAPLVFLARERGGVFISLPDAASSGVDLVQALATSIREYGEFATEVARSISDGVITADELARIEREGDEAVEAIISMKKLARSTHETQYGKAGAASRG